ncbi:MAG: nitroreductase family protein [Thermodesulfobacteriota bacterium]
MDIYEAIRIRRNVHRYKKERVPMQKIKKALEAGLQASSAHNEQPWEFIMVTDPDQVKKLAQYKYDHNMQGLIASNVPREEADKMASTQRDAFTNTMPVAVIYDRRKRLPVESSWSCIATVWLAACAEGLAASPAFFALHAQGPLKEALGIPDSHDIAVILRVGIPEAIPDAKPRKGLAECLFYNRYGVKE